MKRVPPKYLPIAGLLVGAMGGAVYWVAAQCWPSSIAVVLSLFSMALVDKSGCEDSFAKFQPSWLDVFVLLIEYNTLMALTAANLPFSLPANVALALIMICGHGASYGLLVSLMTARTEIATSVSTGELIFALGTGLAPAALLGIPGLAGLAAAILMRLALSALASAGSRSASATLMKRVQPLTEACFYLGALATWKYV